MSSRRSPPASARVLTWRVDAYARERGLPPKRVRDWVSYMILGGRLERASATANGPRFTIKGAVAIEMRLPAKARATKDIDLVVEDPADKELTAALRDALKDGYQGFTFRVRGEPHVMPNDAVRTDVVLEYRGRSWGTIQVDLSAREGDQTEVELVAPLDLEPFGLDTPEALPCLSLRYHVAQKIHAMTAPPPDEETLNERFRDLVDLLLMRELAADLAGVREACVEAFAIRATHDWPPVLDPPAFWEGPFAALADQLEIPVRRLEDAVREAQVFINAIEEAG
ncbi:MAG: nucleotidyl transferase AbiEii/AbiGii toxin family protein [Gemmatimonadota bacterium]